MVYQGGRERRDPPESLAKLLIFPTSRAYARIALQAPLVHLVFLDFPETKDSPGPQGKVDKTASRARLDQPDLRGLLELMAQRGSKETEALLVLPETKEIRVTQVPPVIPAPRASWDQLVPTGSPALQVLQGPLEKRAKRVSKESRDHQAFRD